MAAERRTTRFSGISPAQARPTAPTLEVEHRQVSCQRADVAQVPSPHQMRMFTEVGRRVFPHAAGVGKAILSQLPDERVIEIVRRTGMPAYTPTTITSEAALLADLQATRQRGYAIDEGEQEVGVRCYALPVAGLAMPAAISVSGPESRVTLASVDRMVQLLREAGALLRAAMPGA